MNLGGLAAGPNAIARFNQVMISRRHGRHGTHTVANPAYFCRLEPFVTCLQLLSEILSSPPIWRKTSVGGKVAWIGWSIAHEIDSCSFFRCGRFGGPASPLMQSSNFVVRVPTLYAAASRCTNARACGHCLSPTLWSMLKFCAEFPEQSLCRCRNKQGCLSSPFAVPTE